MQIIIPGKPQSQTRTRYYVLNGNVIVYDPLSRQKKVTAKYILENIPEDFELISDAKISFIFFFPMISGMRKRERELAENDSLLHSSKPDIDNLIKYYLDCLVGTVLSDDRGIHLERCYKIYSSSPRVLIDIQEIKPEQFDIRLPDVSLHS